MWGSSKNRFVASTTSQIVMIHIVAIEIIVPMISALCHPYERESLEDFCASFSAICVKN